MAAKVNTRFVLILATVLVLLAAGGAFIAMQAMKKTSSDHIVKGDEFAAAGDWQNAADSYGQAVNKDEQNIAYIKKWIGALEKLTPATRQQYNELYNTQYFSAALRGLSRADVTSYESQKRYLEEWYLRVTRLPSDLASWEAVETAANDVITRFAGDEQSKKLLTRYRGLARAQITSLKGQRSDEDIAAARADLQTALEGNPADEEAFMTMLALDQLMIQRARDAQQAGKADELQRAVRKSLEDYAAANQPAATVKLRLYLLRFGELSRTSPPGATVRDVVTQLVEPLTQTIVAFEQVPANKVDGRQLLTLALSGAEAIESLSTRVRALLDAAAKAQPENTKLQNSYAEFLLNIGQTDQAIAVWDGVVKRPNPPLSLAGIELMDDQPRALAGQAEAMFASWQKTRDLKEREQFAVRAKGYRDALAALTGEELPMLGALDARLKFISGDVSGARTLISKYNEQTGQRDPASVLLEAEIMRSLGNTGAAETAYKRVLELQPRNVRAMLAMGQMAVDAGRYPEALQYLGTASAIAPNDKDLADTVERLKKISDPNNPLARALAGAQRLYASVNKDVPGAIAILDKAARELKDPPEIMALWGGILAAENRKDEAAAIVARGLARTPDDARLSTLKAQLAIADPYEAELVRIDSMVVPAHQKLTQKYIVSIRAGKPDRARAFLAEAAQLAPEDPAVIETLFVDALSQMNTKELDRLTKLAEDKNLDGLGGLLFRSRRDIAEAQRLKNTAGEAEKANNVTAAAAAKAQAGEVLKNSLQSLGQLTTVDKSNPTGWRLLGAVQLEMAAIKKDLNRNDEATQLLNDAAQSFSKALEIRPEDISSIVGYLRALGQTNQMDKALLIARQKESIAGSSEEFRQIWLSLESNAAQGDRNKAISVRRDILAREPDNTDNRIALVYLLMDQRQWAEADAEILKIKAKGLELQAANLSADVFVRKGDFPAAGKVFRDYIETIPKDKRTAAPYVAAARLMRSIGQVQASLDFYSDAREFQDPTQREIDREIGDTLYQAGDYPSALGIYKTILDGGYNDEGDLVRARVTEGLLNTGNVTEADAVLSKAGTRIASSATLSILAARVAMAQNDRPKARRLLDQAVAAEPKNPVTFLARSDFNVVDPQLTRDVEQDLKEALRLSPTLAAARMRLANLYFTQGNFDAMIAQLRDGVAADPGNDELRSVLCQSLLNLQRNDEAALVVEETIKARPEDVAWLLRGSQLMSQIGKKNRAVDFAKMAFDKQKDVVTAGVYIKTLTSLEPPDTQTALKALALPELDIAKDITAKLLRARVYLKAKSADKALEDMTAAIGLLDVTKPEAIRAYFEVVRELYPDTKDRAALLARLEAIKPFDGWMMFFASAIRIEEATTKDRALADLKRLAESSTDKAIQFACHGMTGVELYRQGKPEEAVASYRKALELSPNDPEMNNNLAYTLGVELGKPADAEPYALRAVAGTPNNALVLDTLGAIQMELGKMSEAEQTLLRAISIARNNSERLPATVRYGLIKLKLGDKINAAKALDDARRIIDADKSLAKEHTKAIRELEDGVAK